VVASVVSRSSLPFAALGAATVAATLAVIAWTPASLLPAPVRPPAAPRAPEVRVDGEAYPRHATGTDDVRTIIGAPPRRLASQSWSSDEFLYSIVPPERVVGVSEGAYEPKFSNVYELARRYQPVIALDVERLLRAAPDLLLTPTEARSEVPGLLRAAGVPVHRIDTIFPTLASLEEHIRLVGYLTGEDARADREIRRFREVVARAAARRPAGVPAPRVMGFGGIYSYGSNTLFHDILRVLGAENVAAMHGFVGYDRVTDEHIVRWDPDWIVAGADRGRVDDVRARLAAHPVIGATTAAARGQIVVLEHHVFLPLSPFTSQLVEALATALYGAES
jgi:iron complex transport system substrate-binding protein